VRWVIILLVIVFDPLAIMLVIAANQSKDWDKEEELLEDDRNAMAIIPPKEEDTRPFTEEEIQALDTEPIASWPFPSARPPEEFEPYVANKFSDIKPVEVVEVTKEEEEVFKELEKKSQPTIEEQMADTVDPEPVTNDDTPNFEGFKDLNTGEWVQTGPAFADTRTVNSTTITVDDTQTTIQPFKRVGDEYVEFEGQRIHRRVLKDLRPDLLADEGNPNLPKVSFGTKFPESAFNGDIYTRVDTIPHRIYKFNGSKWIELKRDSVETHLSDDGYMQHLIEKLSTGEYDPDYLTPIESETIAEYIKTDKS